MKIVYNVYMKANIIIQYPVKTLDKIFTYNIPSSLEGKVKIGSKVKVFFNGSIINGIVISFSMDKDYPYDLKDIISVDESFTLTKEQFLLASFLKKTSLCTLISAIELCLPPSLKISSDKPSLKKYDTYISLNKDENEINKYIAFNQRCSAQVKVLDLLLENKLILKKDLPINSLKTLLKKDLVKEIKKPIYRIDVTDEVLSKQVLNEYQQKAYDKIAPFLSTYKVFLLEGVTGSGKTECYMALIDKVLENKKTALVLVPEICLTTQTVQRFYKRFGSKVAIFHSGLSMGEKYDEYMKIYEKKVSIVVGTRSSIFVPLDNLGIIIIDEEHSDSYKQDSFPRYDAISVASYRAKINNIPLILASATPSLEAKARTLKNVYTLVEIKKRANNNPLPETILVDMQKEKGQIFSKLLIDNINEKLSKKEQIILLLNRRGYSTFITCSNCGYTYKCPNCDITLTYHKSVNSLRCHYCSYNIKKDEICPNCHENALNYLGLGTQKVEDEIKKLFPLAKVLRMDQDTTSKKGSYQNIIDKFSNKEYDILLGTQMISKGLDFANVTLVGVINADTSLNVPDFRANEKTFSLLYQTSGRAGRGKEPGKVIIQTYNPDNKVLNFVKDNNYDEFFSYELNIRHKLYYPPFCYIALIKVLSKDYEKSIKNASLIKNYLLDNLNKDFIILGPTPASLFKINNIYHFQIAIKYKTEENLFTLLQNILDKYPLNKDLNIEITINPSRF